MRGQSRIRLHCRPLEERVVPTTYTVNTLADVVADDGLLSLREALTAASENLVFNEAEAGSTTNDVINFAVPTGSILTLYGGPLVVFGGVTINGTAGLLTLDAIGQNRLFDIRSGSTVILNRLSMVNGYTSNFSTSHGGAILNNGTLTITNSALLDNRAAGMGGAIANYGTLTIRNSLLANNRSEASGLASAGYGGAITNNGTVTIENSTLSGNFASNQGGAIHNNFGATGLTITNSTITNNTVEGNFGGGGIGGSSTNNGTATAVLKNTIVYGNNRNFSTADDITLAAGGLLTGNNNMIGTSVAGLTNGVAGNKIGVDPMLGTLADNGGQTQTHALFAGSSAINAGDSTVMTNIVFDQRSTGYIRNFGVRDIGAFEFQPAPDTSLVVTESGDVVDDNYMPGHLTLREAILTANAQAGLDTITFAPHITNIELTQDQLLLDGDVTIHGTGVTVQRSLVAGPFRLFQVSSGVTAILTGLTLAKGESLANGGAILNSGNLTLRDVTLRNNFASGVGGALLNNGNSDVTIERSTIDANTSMSSGGGIHNGGRMMIEHTTITNNNATTNGGGINNAGQLDIAFSTLANNSGTAGGGLNSTNPVSVSNSTFSGNRANTFGGGIQTTTGRLTLTNTTITQNRSDFDTNASGTGGGVHVVSGHTSLFNTLVADNYRGSATTLEDDITGTVSDRSTNNLIGTGGAGGLTHGANANRVGIADPMLSPIDLVNGVFTHQPLIASPALDGGERQFVVLPASVSSSTSGDDQVAAGQVLSAGLSATPTVANLATITHNTNAANMWTTLNRNGAKDYFGAGQDNPVLTFTMGGTFDFTGIVMWGVNGNKNEAKSFRVEFSSDFGLTFGNAFNVTHDSLLSSTGQLTTFTQPQRANVIRLTITDNFFDNTTGGDRVGLGEVRFLATTGSHDQQGSGRSSGATVDIGAIELPMLLEDDFLRPNAKTPGSPWRTQTGLVSLTNEQLVGGTAKANVATIEGLTLGDVDIQSLVQVNAGQSLSLLARYNGTADRNYYAATLTHDGTNLVASIHRNVNGVVAELASTVVPSASSLRLVVRGDQLTVHVDQQQVLTATDNTFVNGRIGVRLVGPAQLGMIRAQAISQELNANATFDLPDGSPLGTTWQHALGGYQTTFSMARGQSPTNIALVTAARDADVDLSASVEVQPTNGNHAGLVARYAGNGNRNYYLGQILHTTKGPVAQIIKNVNGRVSTLKSVAVSSGFGSLRFLVTGQQLRLFFNNVELTSVIDTAFATGAVGMKSDATSFIDQFRAKEVHTALPFSDAFTGDGVALGDEWTARLGALTIRNNGVISTTTKLTSHLATMVSDATAHADVSADVTVNGLNQRAGLVVRYSGAGDRNYYLGEVLQTKTGPVVRLVKNNNGRLTILGTVEAESSTMNLRLQATGTTLQLYVNDELQLTAIDTTFSRGYVGLRTTGTAVIDNFEAIATTSRTAWNATFTGETGHTLTSNWVAQTGSYAYEANQAGGRASLNLATVMGIDTANSRTTANVQVGPTAGEFASLAARVSGVDAANMYSATIKRVGSTYVATIERKIGRLTTTLASTVVGAGEGLLGFEVNGTMLKLTFGSTTLIANDTALTVGGIGMRSSLDALFDNFSTQVA